MTDQCTYLEYRPLSDAGDVDDLGDMGDSGDVGDVVANEESDGRDPRAYCTAADRFVQAMRADICNLRYGLDPETDCEFYRDAEGLPEVLGSDAENETTEPTDR